MFSIMLIIVEQMMIYMPLVCGAYISFSLLKIPDLSLETSYCIGALCGSFALQAVSGLYTPVACAIVLFAAIAGGMLVGLIASSITFFADIPHLLSSIITFGLFQGLFLIVSNPYVSLASYKNIFMGLPYITYHPELITLLLLNIVIGSVLVYLLRTQLGYSFAIFGNNAQFFHYFKISTGYVFITGVVLAHGLSGLAGYYFAQTNSLVEMNMGVGKALFCITAIIIGKALCGNRVSLAVPLCGAGAYFIIQQLLLQCGFNLKYFTMIQAGIVFMILITIYKRNHHKLDQLGL